METGIELSSKGVYDNELPEDPILGIKFLKNRVEMQKSHISNIKGQIDNIKVSLNQINDAINQQSNFNEKITLQVYTIKRIESKANRNLDYNYVNWDSSKLIDKVTSQSARLSQCESLLAILEKKLKEVVRDKSDLKKESRLIFESLDEFRKNFKGEIQPVEQQTILERDIFQFSHSSKHKFKLLAQKFQNFKMENSFKAWKKSKDIKVRKRLACIILKRCTKRVVMNAFNKIRSEILIKTILEKSKEITLSITEKELKRHLQAFEESMMELYHSQKGCFDDKVTNLEKELETIKLKISTLSKKKEQELSSTLDQRTQSPKLEFQDKSIEAAIGFSPSKPINSEALELQKQVSELKGEWDMSKNKWLKIVESVENCSSCKVMRFRFNFNVSFYIIINHNNL